MTTVARRDLTSEVNIWHVAVARYGRARHWESIGPRADFLGSMPRIIILARALASGDRRVVFAELLDETVPLSECQEKRVEVLMAVAGQCRGHVEVYVWRPHDRKQVMEVLR